MIARRPEAPHLSNMVILRATQQWLGLLAFPTLTLKEKCILVSMSPEISSPLMELLKDDYGIKLRQ